MANTSQPLVKRLQHALVIAEKIQLLEAELASIFGQSVGGSSVAAAALSGPKKRKTRKKRNLSPEAREKIAAAQRARWARVKAKKKG
jgi:hypothetical protein